MMSLEQAAPAHDLACETDAPFQSGRIASLDGLRALAIGGVLWSKAAHTPGHVTEKLVTRVADQGAVGVDLFFVISGFLITTLLMREEQRTGRISLTGFYWRRALRILPAYGALLVVLWGLSVTGQVRMQPIDWLTSLTYTVNFAPVSAWDVGHIWSLSVEEHFYLVWPCLLLWIPRQNWLGVATIGLVVPPLLRVATLALVPEQSATLEVWSWYRGDSIAWGCWLALVATVVPVRVRLDQLCSFRMWWLLPVVLLAVTMLASRSTKFGLGPGYTLRAIACVWLVWGMARFPERGVARLLNTTPFVTVGVLSYSLYLWHRLFLRPDAWQSWWDFPLNIVLLGIVATLSYVLIERPFLRLKDHQGSAGRVIPRVAPAN